MTEIAANHDATSYRSRCPIARTLDLLGDKWSLLILRDALFFDISTFAGFCERPERVPTNLLSSRLKKLVAAGLLKKERYQDRPVRYRYLPTEMARDLIPALQAIGSFGKTYLDNPLE